MATNTNLQTELGVSNLALALEQPHFLNKINTLQDKLGKNILHTFTTDQDVEMLRIILRKIDERLINKTSVSGHTPLCFGLMAKPTSEEFFMELISHPSCDVTIGDKRHLTPLHYAIFHGEKRIAQKLLEHGANIDAMSITGITPLYLAVENNDYEMVCMLMYYNADPNIECEKNNCWSRKITSPILHCIEKDFFDISQLLLDYIADIDKPYSDGYTMLYRALLNASQVTYQLLESGANINHVCYVNHCIMAVTEIYGQVTRQEFFNRMWPMVDVKFMMKYTPCDLFALFFIFNFLSDDFFASIFMDYAYEDTRSFAKMFLVRLKDGRVSAGTDLVRSGNRSEESLLRLFCAALMVCEQIDGYLLYNVVDLIGFGKLFWTFVYFNVEVVHFSVKMPYCCELSMFVFDNNYSAEPVRFSRHYFAQNTEENGTSFMYEHKPFPSLTELARTAVRRSCRHATDNMHCFNFLHRIKSLGLHKICEEILLLRRPIYHF